MRIWALADLHLSFGVPNKEMGVFGPNWENHPQKIEREWRSRIADDDLVLIAGDISWALKLEDALIDLQWIANLPGIKVLSKGNHDLWWSSMGKMRPLLPPRMHLIHKNAFTHNGVTIGGTRLWDHLDNTFGNYIVIRKPPSHVHVHEKVEDPTHDEKIYKNELERLHTSLRALDPRAKRRIAMLHYPPTGPHHNPTEVTDILESYKIDTCVYGHIHNLVPDAPVNFTLNGIRYFCTACDFLHFTPISL